MNGRKSSKNENMFDEADIGSGEITPGQEDTEKFIEQIGKSRQNLPDKKNKADKAKENKHKESP